MFVDFTVPTKHEDITVITFRFSDIVRILSYWNGTQLWNNIIKKC